jgi:hypothetical protein
VWRYHLFERPMSALVVVPRCFKLLTPPKKMRMLSVSPPRLGHSVVGLAGEMRLSGLKLRIGRMTNLMTWPSGFDDVARTGF